MQGAACTGTDWKKVRRILRRRTGRFLQKNRERIRLISLSVICFVAGVVISAMVGSYIRSMTINDYGRQLFYASYTLKSDDTVWGIAEELMPLNPEFNDIRQYVSLIERVNRIDGDKVRYGQVIYIPYYADPNGSNYSGICLKYGIGTNKSQ